ADTRRRPRWRGRAGRPAPAASQPRPRRGSFRSSSSPSACWHRTEPKAEPPVLAPLLLDLADMDFAHLRRGGDMGATAGLAVDRAALADADQADAARAGWRSHVLGFHQRRI